MSDNVPVALSVKCALYEAGWLMLLNVICCLTECFVFKNFLHYFTGHI